MRRTKRNKKMKKTLNILRFLMLFLVIVLSLILFEDRVGTTEHYWVEVDGLECSSKYICVMERGSKEILYKKNPRLKAYPASLTKMMSALVALEKSTDLKAMAPIDRTTYREMVARNSSMAGFFSGEKVTYADLLYGTMLSSGGEAANSLAIHVAGSKAAFVQLMNEKAVALGLANTCFQNPEGLHHPEQYSSAYDLACLLDYALDNELFREIFTTSTFMTTSTQEHPRGICLKSTVLNRLRGIEQEGFLIVGGKSGTTSAAGECWATLAIKEGKEYICVVMGAFREDDCDARGMQIEDTLQLLARLAA